MGLKIRENNRYEKFKANSNMGEVYVELHIYGFGEELKIYDKSKVYAHENTYENDEDGWFEDDECIKVYNDYGCIKVKKPFIKCLKRY